MPYDTKTYDDDRELTSYVWRNYRNLITPLESIADKTIQSEIKAQHASPKMASMLRHRWGCQNDPAVVAVLEDGPEAFRDRVRDRLLRDCTDQIILNRCPQCSRLVATPQAKQCLWCGHDWHSNVMRTTITTEKDSKQERD